MHISLSEEIWSNDLVADTGTGLCVAPVASVDDDDDYGVDDDFDDDDEDEDDFDDDDDDDF